MKVLMVSKALVSASYRKKLDVLTDLGVEVVAVVPPHWREAGGVQHLETGSSEKYDLVVSPMRWNGHFHVHYYPELPELLTGIRPDLLHMDEEPFNLATYLAVLAASRREIPSVFFSWQNLCRRYPPPFGTIERAVYRTAAHAVAGSDEVAAVLRAKGFSKGISVVPQFGVDIRTFTPGERPGGPFTLGFLNRLIPAKGPILMLDAFETLPGDARLIIVGDGPLRSELARQVERRRLSNRVEIRHRLPSGDVPSLLRRLHVVVLPSLTTRRWKEQFGRVLVEAMASGTPVVGSSSGEIPRVIGDAGIVFPEGDPAALASALRSLHADGKLWQALSCRGRDRAVRLFANERIARMTREAYEAALRPYPPGDRTAPGSSEPP